jgi:hypothetical protein
MPGNQKESPAAGAPAARSCQAPTCSVLQYKIQHTDLCMLFTEQSAKKVLHVPAGPLGFTRSPATSLTSSRLGLRPADLLYRVVREIPWRAVLYSRHQGRLWNLGGKAAAYTAPQGKEPQWADLQRKLSAPSSHSYQPHRIIGRTGSFCHACCVTSQSATSRYASVAQIHKAMRHAGLPRRRLMMLTKLPADVTAQQQHHGRHQHILRLPSATENKPFYKPREA